ncbi:hypothetical protein GF345_00090 [Candidatus Woesearchaeota archaeon]|nr:hypothetical protein [Candidatus Woesearchaeota archaeon]
MGIWEWQEKLVKKASERNIRLAIIGKLIALIAIGALFSVQLIQYGYYIVTAATLILGIYFVGAFARWRKKKITTYSNNALGWIGMALLALYLGIQSPQIPYSIYILGLGIILTIPSLIEVVKGLKK